MIQRWAKENSLWIVSAGLMLASSGLDGMYMSAWMPGGWAWLGLALNTMSDVAGMVLMYWYGRLRLSPRGSKRYKLAAALLPAELVAVAYSWLFGWRQLRAVLPAIEPEHWRWVAPIAAGFIPLMLAFIGYAQSLLAGKLDIVVVEQEPKRARAEPEPYHCDECARGFATQQALNAHSRVHSRSNGKAPIMVPTTAEEEGA